MSKVKERISGWDQSTVYLASLDDQILPAESFNGCHSKFGQSGWKPGDSGHSGSSLDTGVNGGGSKQQLGKGHSGSRLDTGGHGGGGITSRLKLGYLSSLDTDEASLDTQFGGITSRQQFGYIQVWTRKYQDWTQFGHIWAAAWIYWFKSGHGGHKF